MEFTRKPWYVTQTAYWLFSICLLSWPFRIYINSNTGILNYQIIKLFGSADANADSSTVLNDERSNFTTSNDDLLGNHQHHHNLSQLPPSYSQAMLWPPTYSYIKQLLYDQANPVAENQLDNANENVNYVLDRIDKYQQQQTNTNDAAGRHHSSLVEASLNMNKLAADHQTARLKSRIPSSLSCSFLNGQIVYTVNTLKNNTTATLNSAIDDLSGGNSLDVKGSTTADCSPILNANSRVQIIGSGSLHETENLPLHLDTLSRALMIDERQQQQPGKLAMLGNSSSQMLNSCRALIPRSFTSTALSSSYLKRFSIRILRRIKSMQNLNANSNAKPQPDGANVQNL